jgi:WD40 repeat protein
MKPLSEIDFIQAYLDGLLSPDQTQALENRLRHDPRFADLLLRVSREEAVMTEWSNSRAAVRPGRRIIPLKPPRRRWAIAILATSAAAAAVALAWLGGTTVRPGTGPQQFVKVDPTEIKRPDIPEMKLGDIQGDEVYVVSDVGETAAKSGQTLFPGQSVRVGKDSSAVLMSDANRLELGTETTVKLLVSGPPALSDPRSLVARVFLEEGTLGVEASNKPMVVATPHAEARLSESRANFTSVKRETRIEQERGQLQLTRKSDGQSINVPTDSWAVATSNSTEQFAPQPMPQTTQSRMVLKEAGKEAQSAFNSLAYSPDGTRLAAGCADGSVKFWNMTASGLAMAGLKTGGRGPVRAIAFSPDSMVFAATSEDRNVKLYATASHQELGVLKGHKHPINCLAFSPNGILIATGGGNQQKNTELKLWNLANRQELTNLTGQSAPVLSVAFSPDSRYVAAGCRDGTVRIWEIASRELKQTLTGHTAQVNAVAFAPRNGGQNGILASAGKDLTVKFWDIATGTELRTFAGLTSEVRSIAFSPDGKVFAAADHNVRLWDATTGQQLRMLKGHKNAITALVFSPKGKEIATAGTDRTVRVWDVPVP